MKSVEVIINEKKFLYPVGTTLEEIANIRSSLKDLLGKDAEKI